MCTGPDLVTPRLVTGTSLSRDLRRLPFAHPVQAAWLGDEITHLLVLDSDRQSLGERGATVARRFDWDILAPRLETIYRRVTTKRDRGSAD